MGQLKKFDTLIHHNLSSIHDSESCKTLLHRKHRCSFIDQIDVDFLQQRREKAGLVEPPWLRAEAKSEQVALLMQV